MSSSLTDLTFAFFSLQLKSCEVDHSIDLTLGNFNVVAPHFSASDTNQFMGITSYPTTPVAPRQMPPLAYPQPKQSATFVNGVTSASGTGSNNNIISRPYTNSNNNNAININGNPTPSSGANSYQQKSSSTFTLAPPPQSRASITPSVNNTFVRPPDAKPLNGRSSYPTNTQSSKHEVSSLSLSRKQFYSLIDCSGRLLCDTSNHSDYQKWETTEDWLPNVYLFLRFLFCVTQLVSVSLFTISNLMRTIKLKAPDTLACTECATKVLISSDFAIQISWALACVGTARCCHFSRSLCRVAFQCRVGRKTQRRQF